MPPPTIRRSLLGLNCLSRRVKPSPSCNASSNVIEFRRGEATYRRHVKKLSIPPAPSFGPQKPTRRKLDDSIPPSSHIIFNPPPTAPNVYHTPLKFMPKHDKRRQLYTNAPSLYTMATSSRDVKNTGGTSSSSSPSPSPLTTPGTALHEIAAQNAIPSGLLPRVPESDPMPPAVKRQQEKKYHVTTDQVAEMQALRKADPKQWTIDRLADKYNCSTLFVRICAKSFEAGEAHFARLDEVKQRWGRKKTLARQDRRRRKDLWGLDA